MLLDQSTTLLAEQYINQEKFAVVTYSSAWATKALGSRFFLLLADLFMSLLFFKKPRDFLV